MGDQRQGAGAKRARGDGAGRPYTPEQVAAAFRGTVPRKRPSAAYRLWIAVVALVMATLPLIYLAVVGAACYAMYWHATRNYVVFQEVRSARAAAFAYAAPLVILGVVVFFLAKPLFARRPERFRARSLDPEREPALFELVDGVCEALGAPRPVRIEVDCDVNASAAPERGLFSILRRRLVLTIGLPLAASLDAREFAGVLAHEFGHFSQSAGMSLSYLIRSVNAWFARIVYGRDAWDARLEAWSREGYLPAMAVAGLARLIVWATRRLLWALMVAGHAVSCTMSRQMEFDADRCQALLTGSGTVRAVLGKVGLLAAAQQGAGYDLNESWKEGKLPDDLPRLIEANVGQLPEPVRRSVEAGLLVREGGVFDTHPPDGERIARAEAREAAGVLRLAGPASALFRNFEALSRQATIDHYRGLLGDDFHASLLRPLREVVRQAEGRQEGAEAFGRVYQGSWPAHRTVQVQGVAKHAGAAEAVAALRRVREAQAAGAAERRRIDEAEAEAFRRLSSGEVAGALLTAGLRVDRKEWGLRAASPAAAREAWEGALEELERLARASARVDARFAERTALALGMLRDEAFVAAHDAPGTLRREVRKVLPVAVEFGRRAWPHVTPVLRGRAVLMALIAAYHQNEGDSKVGHAALDASRLLSRRLRELRSALGDVKYPFDHARAGVTVAEYVLPEVPDGDDVGAVIGAADAVADRLVPLYFRVLSRLAAAVERVEGALGLPPLAFEAASGDNHARE